MSITIIGDNYDDDDDDDDTSKKHFLSLYGPSIKWINKYIKMSFYLLFFTSFICSFLFMHSGIKNKWMDNNNKCEWTKCFDCLNISFIYTHTHTLYNIYTIMIIWPVINEWMNERKKNLWIFFLPVFIGKSHNQKKQENQFLLKKNKNEKLNVLYDHFSNE